MEKYKEGRRLVVYHDGGHSFLVLRDVILLEAVHRKTQLHMVDGRVLLSTHPIGRFVDLMDDSDFVLVHRSYLINMRHVIRYDGIGILDLSSDISVPLSKRRKKAFELIVRERYLTDGRI